VDASRSADAFDAYLGARREPTWKTRWRTLDPAERSWLAVVATSRPWIATLTDPEEIRLAKGCRRHESRRSRFDHRIARLLERQIKGALETQRRRAAAA
jgi:hypothetical protein